MRPLRYSINVMLDGCVDHRVGVPDEDVHRVAAEHLERCDALLLGRVVYEMMESAWRPPALDAMPEWAHDFGHTIDRARKHVVSSTLESVDWNAELVTGDLETAVRALKEQPGTGIATGGVTLPTALAELGLIDEYQVVVHPVVAGRGPRLLEGLSRPLDLELVEVEELGSGTVVRRYVPRTA
ncbi:MAG: dihydrofolate reductase family protein [Aeromicrobium erythreum]